MRIDLSKTHPTLYRLWLSGSVFCVMLAANFWFAHPPTFNPFGIPKNVVGVVFFILGVAQIFCLTVLRDLRAVRLTSTALIFWAYSWGLLNTEQGLKGHASFQLPGFCLWVATWSVLLMLESPVNPMTRKATA